MLETRALTRFYGRTPAIRDVDLAIPRERAFAILGTSGAGKTTLLQCLGRFLEPTSGSVLLNATPVADIPREEFRRRIGIVFQGLYLFPHLTLLRNMTLAPTTVYGESAQAAETRAKEMASALGIADLLDKHPSAVSGGQAQRAALGRALLLRPEYLLLDEPTSALDVETTRSLAALLRGLATETTFVIVTHDLPFARDVAEHAVLMRDGAIVARGTVADIEAAW